MNPRTVKRYIVFVAGADGSPCNCVTFRDLVDAELYALTRQAGHPNNTYYIAEVVGVTRRVDKPQYEIERI